MWTSAWLTKKGRAVGFQIIRYEVEHAPAPEGACGYYTREPGRYYVAQFHVTRDGEPYGALTRDAIEPDRAALEKEVARRLNVARKNQVKKYTV